MNDEDTAMSEYLQMYHTRDEISKEFNLSNTVSWHKIKKYVRYDEINCVNLTGCLRRKRGIIKVYRWENEISDINS